MRQSEWKVIFDFNRVESKALDMLDLKIDDVSAWIEATGGLETRLSYIGGGGMANGPLFHQILKPLLSMGTSGSITVERVAKPLKNYVLTKHRNKLGLERANMLLRLGLNLRFLAKQRGIHKGALLQVTLEDMENEADEWMDRCEMATLE
jgi:hypothetical protein